MEKINYPKIPHSNKERIGIPTGLLNCKGNEIITGDYIKIENTNCIGPVLYNRYRGAFGICYGCWYLNKNPLNPDCYGKFISIPTDQGMRMILIPISNEDVDDLRNKGEIQ